MGRQIRPRKHARNLCVSMADYFQRIYFFVSFIWVWVGFPRLYLCAVLPDTGHNSASTQKSFSSNAQPSQMPSQQHFNQQTSAISFWMFHPYLCGSRGSPCRLSKKTLVSHVMWEHVSGNSNNSLMIPRQHMFFVVDTFILADSSVLIFAAWKHRGRELCWRSPLCQRLAALLIAGFGLILLVGPYTWTQFARQQLSELHSY